MPEWLWSVAVGIVVVGLVAALRHSDQQRIDDQFKAILDQIGRDSQSGMRKTLHDTANAVSECHIARRLIDSVEERLGVLERRLRK